MDFSYLNSISAGDLSFIDQFIKTFESNTTKIVGSMRQALGDNKMDELKALAHQLKPTLEMLKLDCLELCKEMNHNPKSANLEQIDDIMAECLATTKALKEKFKAL